MKTRDYSWLCFILVLENIQAALSPNGDNVCLFEERYIKTIQVREMVPVKVMKVKWCWKMPPRCTTEETEMRPQIIDKEVPRTKIVAKCCRGYASDITESKCIPVCSEPCIHGICAAPDKCSCESGFYGEQCHKQCLPGYWGRGCVEKCDCENDAICGSVHGECTCLAGWQGARCEYPCYEGYYGLHCDHRCDCKGESCDHINGTCISTTTEFLPTTEAVTKSETISIVTDYTTTQTNFIDEFTANFTTVIFDETNATDLAFVNTNESPTSEYPPEQTPEYATETESIDTLEIPKTTSTIFDIETPVTKLENKESTTQQIATKTQKSTTVASTSTTSEISNEIEYSQNFKTITVKSQIEKINLLGLIPSLSLVSGVAILIFVVTMGSIMFNHFRKIKRLAVKQDQVIKINPADLGIHKFYGESTLPVKTIFENPVYSTDVDFEKDQPTLQSFKPLPPPIKEDEFPDPPSMEEIDRGSLETAYEHPMSNRSTSNEHLYHEISVVMNYDVPKRISGNSSYYS